MTKFVYLASKLVVNRLHVRKDLEPTLGDFRLGKSDSPVSREVYGKERPENMIYPDISIFFFHFHALEKGEKDLYSKHVSVEGQVYFRSTEEWPRYSSERNSIEAEI